MSKKRPVAIYTEYRRMLADTVTPVSIYLRVRDVFPGALLLESNEYRSSDNSFSFICCNPVASISVENGALIEQFPGGDKKEVEIAEIKDVPAEIDRFARSFSPDTSVELPFISNGLFGFTSYDAIEYFEDIELHAERVEERDVPALHYSAFEYVIAIDHFHNELYLIRHKYGEGESHSEISIEDFLYLISNKDFPSYGFKTVGEEQSNFEDAEFITTINQAKENISRGDVFQVVISRCFSQQFTGDDFNVYRTLRSINPSPYLFYFDYGNFKIMGSSPEAQLVIKDRQAAIYPIAGTFRLTGDEGKDQELARELTEDPKENAEHVMLVDLARNDLSKHCDNVEVSKFREVQFFSHVIHLVSKVIGALKPEASVPRIVADTFPAGTLSGAPKYRAMELIDGYERGRRSLYGGSIGFHGFNGDYNHAIVIRSLLCKNNKLFYQAGAGVVADSNPDSELQEVFNKCAAPKSAIALAAGDSVNE